MSKGMPKSGVNKGWFKKGRVSLWKGKTNRYSEETIKKIKEARKKQICTLETRKKMSIAHKGKNCHWWKHGESRKNRAERKLIMDGYEYRFWRNGVFKKDNYTCIWCGDSRGGNLEADHIKTWRDYPELRFAIDNGRTLCHKCHKTTETYGNNK